jgi:hypothetical protein
VEFLKINCTEILDLLIYFDNVSYQYRPIVPLVSQGRYQKRHVVRQVYIVKQIILKIKAVTTPLLYTEMVLHSVLFMH